jgi:hypothetical protein
MKIKDYIKQFYTEGFATTFYQKPTKFINKKIKNKKTAKFINELIKILYTVVFLGIAIVYVYNKLK